MVGADRRRAGAPAGAADPAAGRRGVGARDLLPGRHQRAGTYPAGRFVPLVPARGGRYRLDFNRARNPFCAYSSAYPCPAPWRGNTIPAPVEAGERYLGGGLDAPTPGPRAAEGGETAWRARPGSRVRCAAIAAEPAAARGARCSISPAATLPFSAGSIGRQRRRWTARCATDAVCQPFSAVRVRRATRVALEMADYAATIHGASARRIRSPGRIATWATAGRGSSRSAPARGPWPVTRGAGPALLGRWDATFFCDFGVSPRVFELRNGPPGLEGTMISNTGDYGHFAGRVEGDSFALAHFDGVVRVPADRRARHGDTLRGIFHAGLRTPDAVDRGAEHRAAPHLKTPPRSRAPTPPRRSGSRSRIWTAGW